MDPLDRFTRALAAEHDGEVAAPGVTRSRILERLAKKRSPRTTLRVVWMIPLFVFGAGTALAASGQLPRVVKPVAQFLAGDEGPASPKQKKPARVATSSPLAPSAKPPVPEPTARERDPAEPAGAGAGAAAAAPEPALPRARASEPAVLTAPSARASTSATATTATTATATGTLAGAPEPSPSVSSAAVHSIGPPQPTAEPNRARSAPAAAGEPGLDLYAAAHRAQFSAKDYAAAARHYRKYLKKAPTGSFVTEARYNLSLCLLRLGRTAEARPLLSAFASGAYGNYRKVEAKRLLDALP